MKHPIALVAIHQEQSPQAMPLGLACLKAAITARPELDRHIQCIILDAWPRELPETTIRRVRETAATIVGFSVFSWNLPAVQTCIRGLVSSSPDIRIILGGPEAYNPDLAHLEGVDTIIQGEGEEAFCAWLAEQPECMPPGQGLNARPYPRGEVRMIQGLAENPRALVSPWLSGALDPAAYGGVLWELARGCPFRCSYCFESRLVPGVRHFDQGRIEAELECFAKKGVSQVFVLDPTFNADRGRALAILGLIRKICPDIHFHFEIRAEFLDAEQAELFAQGPCSLQIGLQSAHPAVLEKVGRPFNPGLFRKKIGLLNTSGAIFGLDLMYGLPGDTFAGFAASIDWALELEPNHLDLFPLSILPGTQLQLDAPGLGLEWDQAPPYRVSSSPGFPACDMARAARLAEAVQLLYCQGRAVGWFMRVAGALGTKPSELAEGFALWLEGGKGPAGSSKKKQAPSPADIPALQKAFLGERARSCGLDALVPVFDDLVGFHAAWAALAVDKRESRIVLGYDPDVLNGPEGRKLLSFARSHRPRPQGWAFRYQRGQPVYFPLGR